MRESSKRSDRSTFGVGARARIPIAVFLVAVASLGCGAGAAPAEGDPKKRVPDGVAIDGVMAPPPASEVAESGASVVTLKAPLGDDAAFEALRRYFEAVSSENADALRRTLSSDALFVNPSTNARDNAFLLWSRRFSRLDYRSVSAGGIVSRENVSLRRVSERDAVRGDTDIEATLRLSAAAPPALFGESMVARLRREEGRFVIVEIVEDFLVP